MTIAISRPLPANKNLQNLCPDAGYSGYAEVVESNGYISHIRPRGEENFEIEHNPNFKAKRWIVEVSHS